MRSANSFVPIDEGSGSSWRLLHGARSFQEGWARGSRRRFGPKWNSPPRLRGGLFAGVWQRLLVLSDVDLHIHVRGAAASFGRARYLDGVIAERRVLVDGDRKGEVRAVARLHFGLVQLGLEPRLGIDR